TTPFLDEKRKMPVWFDNQETIEYEGEIIFPKGISIEDTPSNESFHTTETYKYNFFCEKGKVNDNNVLKIKFVYTHPLICSVNDYKILKHFYIQIAKLLNSKVALKKNENIL
ncbi:MAG: hypothetical protein N2445_01065, partial [Acidobacteria bacterium]|nr:hypothetical protein [Acidobacteriota bacterium]